MPCHSEDIADAVFRTMTFSDYTNKINEIKNTHCPILSRNPSRIILYIVYNVPFTSVIICIRLIVFIELKMATWYSALQMFHSLVMSETKK